jgi:hypothetical protein
MALALGSRRSTIAAVTSAVAAMAVAIAVASFRVTEPGPDDAVRDMLRAAQAGDVDLVYELLGPATRARLDLEAKRATDYVGAATRYTAKDLVSIGTSENVATPTSITVVDKLSDRARVLVVSETGRSYVELVRVNDAWRIELAEYGPIKK